MGQSKCELHVSSVHILISLLSNCQSWFSLRRWLNPSTAPDFVITTHWLCYYSCRVQGMFVYASHNRFLLLQNQLLLIRILSLQYNRCIYNQIVSNVLWIFFDDYYILNLNTVLLLFLLQGMNTSTVRYCYYYFDRKTWYNNMWNTVRPIYPDEAQMS